MFCSFDRKSTNTDIFSALSHRHYHPSSKDHEVFSSRHPDTDMPRLDRSRGSGHDSGHVYMDKSSRDDHMKADPPYPPRGIYEEPVRSQDVGDRPSSLHNDVMGREPILPIPHSRRRESVSAVSAAPIVSASMIVENARGRSRDRSPRTHHEPRQTGTQPSSAPLPAMQSGPPLDTQFIEDRRHRERRIDHEREVGMSLFSLNFVG